MSYPVPPEEQKRLEALYRLDLFDNPPEERFDRIVDLAAQLFGVSSVAVSLVDSDQQWFMASCGLLEDETPREHSFCAHAIMEDAVMVVEDARSDPRFADNPFVTGEKQIRFYAGKPLSVENGYRIGTLCLVDDQPRSFTQHDQRALEKFGELVEDEIKFRREMRRVQILSSALEETEEAVIITEAEPLDPPGPQIRWINEAFTRLTGYERGDLEEHSPRILQGEGTSRAALDQIRDALERGEPHEAELVNYRKDGEPYVANLSIAPVRMESGEVIRWVSVQRDVTRQRRREQQLEYEATHDDLTGLLDRNGFATYVDHLFGKSSGSCKGECSLLYMDLDQFKLVNDTLGHSTGDRLLRAVADRLRETVRGNDPIARLGGDEFAILIQDAGTVDEATQAARRVCEQLSQSYEIDGNQVYAPPSIGVVPHLAGYEDPEAVLRDADLAMYQAKDDPERCYLVYEQAFRDQARSRFDLETDLREALADRQFEAYFHPIVEIESGALAGVETLTRWNHPERGQLAPDRFLEVAEERGLLGEIGEQVLEKAFAAWRDWPMQTDTEAELYLLLSVNFSRSEFLRSGTFDRIGDLLEKHEIPPESFVMEITEQVLHDRADEFLEHVKLFEEMGVRLSLDDFGTGYSSLRVLRDLPVEMVKLDKSLMEEIDRSPDSRTMVQAVIDLTQTLGKTVVAEGIEETEQLEVLRELGCDLGQGYLFARPLSGEEMSTLLQGERPWKRLWN